MFVCLCGAVSDSTVKRAIREGCNTLKKLQQATGVMQQCCKCCDDCKQLLNATLTESDLSEKAASTPL